MPYNIPYLSKINNAYPGHNGVEDASFTHFIRSYIYHTQSLINKKEESKPVQKEEKYPKEYKASLVMVGDALIHNSVYDDAKTANGYDFKPMIENIKPIIKENND